MIKKKPKGLIGRYKIAGQIFVGLVVGGIIYFFPQWIDPDLWRMKSSTTVPFYKYTEFDFGLLYIPMVIFVITATSNAVNLTDGLDGLAIGNVGIVSFTLAIMTYVFGSFHLEPVPDNSISSGQWRTCHLLLRYSRSVSWISLVQFISGASVYGGYRIAGSRRHYRRIMRAH